MVVEFYSCALQGGVQMAEELLTVEELRARLKTSRRNIERLRKQGMPYMLLGKSPRFDFHEVLEWMRRRKEEEELAKSDVEF